LAGYELTKNTINGLFCKFAISEMDGISLFELVGWIY